MSARKPFGLTTPCAKCPFRNDRPGYLRQGRVSEIQQSLTRAAFHCHLTTKHDDEGDIVQTSREQHCAGALILLEKIGRPSQMMRIAERLGLYDPTKLDMAAPVFSNFAQMARAHCK